MASKLDRVLAAYPNAVLDDDFVLQNDGRGTYISRWNEAKLGPRPRLEDLPEPPPEYHAARKVKEAERLISSPAFQGLIDAISEITSAPRGTLHGTARKRIAERL